MDLDEYVWRRKVTLKKMSEETGICAVTLSQLRNFKVTPKLDTALKIHEVTNGEVSYLEMLPPEARKKIEKWLAR